MTFPFLVRSRKRRPGRKPQERPLRLPRLEELEDRTALSTLTVLSAADDGSAGTLRAVLAGADDGDVVVFAPQVWGHTITLTQGQLVIDDSLTIDGPGAGMVAVSGNNAGRIFEVVGGTTATISGLTLKGGRAGDGAAVLNAGHLTLSGAVLSGNMAEGLPGGAGRGGGVGNLPGATLVVCHSVFAGNQALGGPGGGNALGGGIYNEGGTVTIDHSTFDGNKA